MRELKLTPLVLAAFLIINSICIYPVVSGSEECVAVTDYYWESLVKGGNSVFVVIVKTRQT